MSILHASRIRCTLVVDTSCPPCLLSLKTEEGIFSETWIPQQHLESTLFEKIITLLAEQDCTPQEIDAILVNPGPGTYMGTRVALALVNTLALLYKTPVICLDGLRLIAHTAPQIKGYICAAICCIRDEIFYQEFYKDADVLTALSPPSGSSLEDFSKFCATVHQTEGAVLFWRAGPQFSEIQERIFASFPFVQAFDFTSGLDFFHKYAGICAERRSPAEKCGSKFVSPFYLKPEL